jgi:hypothetical protein
MAYAEGTTALGRTFAQIFDVAAKKTALYDITNNQKYEYLKNYTLVFELTSPETRVTTPFNDTNITLIAARSNRQEDNFQEYTQNELDNLAKLINCGRPKTYNIMSEAELLELVNYFPCMEEGVVLVWEQNDGSHIRLKCKNPAFVAISHMRNNGVISPKRILTLVMANEQHEYLKYFQEDSSYIKFVEDEFNQVKERINYIYNECKDIVVQKDYAIVIMSKVKYNFESGVLFSIRKTGKTISELLKEVGPEKIAKSMDLKNLFIKKFNIVVDEES